MRPVKYIPKSDRLLRRNTVMALIRFFALGHGSVKASQLTPALTLKQAHCALGHLKELGELAVVKQGQCRWYHHEQTVYEPTKKMRRPEQTGLWKASL